MTLCVLERAQERAIITFYDFICYFCWRHTSLLLNPYSIVQENIYFWAPNTVFWECTSYKYCGKRFSWQTTGPLKMSSVVYLGEPLKAKKQGWWCEPSPQRVPSAVADLCPTRAWQSQPRRTHCHTRHGRPPWHRWECGLWHRWGMRPVAYTPFSSAQHHVKK